MRHDSAKSSHTSSHSVNPYRAITQSAPPDLAPKTAQRTWLGHRLLGALTGGPDRKFSAHHSPPGGGASPSLLMNRRFAFPILALLAVLAFGLLFLLPGGPLHAQDANGPIEYAENGTDPVATFTGTDPEDRMVYWSLLDTDTLPSPAPTVDGTALENDDFEDNGDFSINADGVLTFNIPPDHEMPMGGGTADNSNTYNIVVVASDNAPGAGTTDNPIMMGYKRVVIEVTDVDEPGVVTLSSLQPQVGADLMATLVDPEVPNPTADGNDLAWKWEKSQDKSSWEPIDGAGTEDMYGPDASTEDYYLRATATYDDDDGNERTFAAVSVNKVRAAPDTTDATATFPDATDANNRSVDENEPADTMVGKPVAASDTGDEVLTYSLTGNNADSFRIDPKTGQITVGPLTMLDHETTPTYSVTVSVIGAGGGDAVPQPVTITVNDVNEAPMMTGGVTMMELAEYDADTAEGDADDEDTRAKTVSDYTASDPEDDTPTWSLKGADMDKLMISSGGALTFKKAPNYEMPADAGRDNVYNVTVVATDTGTGKGNKMTAERMVVIMVTNVEEDGTVELSAQQPKIGVAVTASVTDPDGTPTGVSWKWERDDDQTDAEDNTGDEELIEGAESATYTPTSDDNGKYLRAIATYTDGKGRDTSMATSVAMVEVRTDNPPEFPETEDGKRSIGEGMSGEVGEPVRAMDMETTQLLTYSLSGTDSNSFEIKSDTDDAADDRGGQISVKSGVKLDYETKKSYMVTVTATDPDNLSASIDVTIMVVDMDEAPTIMAGGLGIGGQSTISYAEDGTGMVATYSAIGPDAASATWDLSGDDAGDFRINSAGVLTFMASPDYETPADADTNNVYMVTVEANDGTNEAMKAVTVTVTNEDDPGTVILSTERPRVGDEITATLTDDDGGISGTTTWLWERSPAKATWTRITGETSMSYTPVRADENMHLRATASYTDAEGSGKSEMAVSANPVSTTPTTGNAVADIYDTNPNNGKIEKEEVFDAIEAYFAQGSTLTKDNVLDIIVLYFAALRS